MFRAKGIQKESERGNASVRGETGRTAKRHAENVMSGIQGACGSARRGLVGPSKVGRRIPS